jgi:hypothetical protein
MRWLGLAMALGGCAWQSEVDTLIGERDALVAERDALVAERDALVAERDALVAERDTLKSNVTYLELERIRGPGPFLPAWAIEGPGRFTAQFGGQVITGSFHWSLYEGRALYRNVYCDVADCSTDSLSRDERIAIDAEWKRRTGR